MNARMVSLTTKGEDIIFFCMEGASLDEICIFRREFLKVYPSVKAVFLNFSIEIERMGVEGINTLIISSPNNISQEDLVPLKRMIKKPYSHKKGMSRYKIALKG